MARTGGQLDETNLLLACRLVRPGAAARARRPALPASVSPLVLLVLVLLFLLVFLPAGWGMGAEGGGGE